MFKKIVFFLLLSPFLAFSETFVAGKDYQIITDTPTKAHKTVQVTEFFSYACPWCYHLEAHLSNWVEQQGTHIRFKRIPVIFNKDWIFYAKAYYTGQALGISKQIDPLLFKTIQIEKKPLNNNDEMIGFFVSQGVNRQTAESAFNHSTTMDMKIKQSNMSMGRYHIDAIPAIVIDGKYKIDLKMAKGEERFFKILDYLMQKEHQPHA